MSFPDGYTDLPPGKIATIVTVLEMRPRPAPRPERRKGAWALRRIEAPGLDWFRALFRRIGEDFLWRSRLLLSDEALAAVIRHPAVEVYALHRIEADGGEAEIGLLELDLRRAGDCEIAFFGLVPEAVGSGAGRWLMNRALELAWRRPIERVWLHTCTADHPAALPFYLRTGFRPIRRRVEVAEDPRLAGVLPRDACPQVPVI